MELLDLIGDYLIDNEEGIRQLLTMFLNLVMDQEASQQAGANRYERSNSRKAHRNGYRSRSLTTRYVELELSKPLLREFPFKTQVFGRYSRTEKALLNAIAESYLHGVSTRRVQEVVSALGVENMSASRVSRIAQELDEAVQEFLSKPIECEIRYLFVDASYFKVRDGTRYEIKALFIVAGVRDDGYREILGAKLADCENESYWSDLFDDLKDRGLKGVKLVISDGHKGIQKAVETSFIGASWQICHVHFIRAVLNKVPKKDRKKVVEMLRDALEDEKTLAELAGELESMGLRNASGTVDRFLYDLMNYRAFPKEHWRRIRTTNILERVNKELKRRSKVAGAFSNAESLMRLAVSILIDINEEWITGRRYLSMECE
jgi:putative transposase